MYKDIIKIILLLMVGLPLTAQSLILDVPEKSAAQGSTVQLAISTEGFTDIVSLQFSINWDATVIQFVEMSMPNLGDAAIGETQVMEGMLRYSWFDIGGSGVTIADEATLLILDFLVIGAPGEQTDVLISGDPLAIQVYQNINGNFEPITITASIGSVSVMEPVTISVAAQTGENRCFGEANGFIDLTLNISTNDYTIQWNGPNGFSASTEDISNLVGGDYQLLVFDIDGNSLLDTIYTIVEPLSALAIGDVTTNNSNCDDTDGSAMISVIGGTPPYSYDIGQGMVAQAEFNNLASGNYMFTITDANQCELTDSFLIDSTPLPELTIEGDFTICEGEISTLSAGNFATYQWSTGVSASTIEVTITGAYSVTVTNNFGCTAAAVATVGVADGVALEIENDVLEICSGESFQLLISGGDQYEWIDSSGTLSSLMVSNPVATPRVSTTYLAIASNSCGSDTAALEMIVNEPTGWAMQDTCVAAGSELQLRVGGGREYQWDENAEFPLNAYNIYNPKTEPEDDTFYAVSILDNNDCVTKDTVFVTVANNPLDVIQPINTLTPNGDGKNDELIFNAINKFNQNRLTVFNRWGDVVYEKVNYQKDGERFDATKNGKPLPAGTYYYVLSFVGGEELKQTLLIVR